MSNRNINLIIKLNKKLCKEHQDIRLSKEVIAYQVLRRIPLEIDTRCIDVIFHFPNSMDMPLEISFENTEYYIWNKKKELAFTKKIASIIRAYMSNAAKEIAETSKLISSKSQSSIMSILEEKGSISTDNDLELMVNTAKSKYEQIVNHFEYNEKSKKINKAIAEKFENYEVYTSTKKGLFTPDRYLELSQHSIPRLWFDFSVDEPFITKTISLIEKFTKKSYVIAYHSMAYKIFGLLDDKVSMQKYSNYSHLMGPNDEFMTELKPIVDQYFDSFIEDNKLLSNPHWINKLELVLRDIHEEENNKAKIILSNKITM